MSPRRFTVPAAGAGSRGHMRCAAQTHGQGREPWRSWPSRPGRVPGELAARLHAAPRLSREGRAVNAFVDTAPAAPLH
jgi:hypothetical protein